MYREKLKSFIYYFTFLALSLLGVSRIASANIYLESGRIVHKSNPYGRYVQYVAKRLQRPVRSLVVVHGSLGKGLPAHQVAENFLSRWIDVAEERGLLLLAPAFDTENFGGKKGPRGGYRGLFGRHIGADEFLHSIVDSYSSVIAGFDKQMYLYGHSAGGQFVARYIMMHPERILAAVISAAGALPFPNFEAPWPAGLGKVHKQLHWPSEATKQTIDIKPDVSKWLMAANLPISVVIGKKDTKPKKKSKWQPGANRLENTRFWHQAMKDFTRQHGELCRIELIEVPNVGHDSKKLTSVAVRALFEGR